ncbi:Uncharacterised protein [uncultured archaeon]|nr:Uncharacterised protein [uncultured archaeon]
MKNNGIFSAEAGLSFMLLIALLAVAIHAGATGTEARGQGGEKIFMLQKMSDLLIVWSAEETRGEEMIEDAEGFIGGEFEIYEGSSRISGEIKGAKMSLEILAMRGGKPEIIRISAPSPMQ